MRTIVAVAFALALSGECAAAQQSITFRGSGGIPLAGTLTLPTSVRPDAGFPAVLLIQGSGPTDRDGNQRPAIVTDLEQQVAELLAAEGVASLRYDKRGMHENRPTLPKNRDEWPAFFSWSAFLQDADSALRFLAEQPKIDRQRIGIFGHSEGGLIALALEASEGPRAKAVVIASTAARPLDQLIHEQLARQLEGASASQRDALLAVDLTIQRRIRSNGTVPQDVPGALTALYRADTAPFLKAVFELDPVALAMRTVSPILAIYGGADVQVSATRDAPLMASALAGRNDGSKSIVVPNVSHNLKSVTKAGDPGFAGPLYETVKRELVTWLRSAL